MSLFMRNVAIKWQNRKANQMSKVEKLTTEFSFELPEHRDLSNFDIVLAAADVMREDPFFQQKRKDGGCYKYGTCAPWVCWGSPEAVIGGMTNYWAVIITPAGGRRFDVRAFNSMAVHRGSCQSFRAIEKRAA